MTIIKKYNAHIADSPLTSRLFIRVSHSHQMAGKLAISYGHEKGKQTDRQTGRHMGGGKKVGYMKRGRDEVRIEEKVGGTVKKTYKTQLIKMIQDNFRHSDPPILASESYRRTAPSPPITVK